MIGLTASNARSQEATPRPALFSTPMPGRLLRLTAPVSIPVPGIGREIEAKLATTEEEWDEAFRLVAANYQSRGYEPAGSSAVRFTPYHALPDTAVFVAKHAGQVVATLSLVPDNVLLGLPMETIYGPEIQALRRAGRHLVEVTSLADQDLDLREFIAVFVTLMRLQAQYGINQDADTWVITVNPRHRNFYRKVMGFVPFGGQRAYPTVQNHPAEAYLLDTTLLRVNAPEMYQRLFGELLPVEALRPDPMPVYLVRHFSSLSSHCDDQQVEQILQYVDAAGSPLTWQSPWPAVALENR